MNEKLKAIENLCFEININFEGAIWSMDAHYANKSFYTDGYENLEEAIDDMHEQLQEIINRVVK